MKTALLKSCHQHADNNCLGTIVRKEGEKDSINYITYKELLEQSTAVGSGIINEKLFYQP
jgi:long-subunit acyl-CoA synthetase (AMP-forming)